MDEKSVVSIVSILLTIVRRGIVLRDLIVSWTPDVNLPSSRPKGFLALVIYMVVFNIVCLQSQILGKPAC